MKQYLVFFLHLRLHCYENDKPYSRGGQRSGGNGGKQFVSQCFRKKYNNQVTLGGKLTRYTYICKLVHDDDCNDYDDDDGDDQAYVDKE